MFGVIFHALPEHVFVCLQGHMKVHSGTANTGPAVAPNTPRNEDQGPLKPGKDTLEDPGAISTNGCPAEEDVEKPSANQDKSCLSDEPMDTSDVAGKAE